MPRRNPEAVPATYGHKNQTSKSKIDVTSWCSSGKKVLSYLLYQGEENVQKDPTNSEILAMVIYKEDVQLSNLSNCVNRCATRLMASWCFQR